jgi:hypothetical protein
VSRDEFHQELWNGSTFVDFEHGLNAAMNPLRQALGDSPDQPRYIETLSGQTSPQSPPAGPTRRKLWPVWMVAAALVPAVGAGYLVARLGQNSSLPTLRFSVMPPNGYALEGGSSHQTFALSPDGTRLAFTAMNASGIFETFVRDLDSMDSSPLPGPPDKAAHFKLLW